LVDEATLPFSSPVFTGDRSESKLRCAAPTFLPKTPRCCFLHGGSLFSPFFVLVNRCELLLYPFGPADKSRSMLTLECFDFRLHRRKHYCFFTLSRKPGACFFASEVKRQSLGKAPPHPPSKTRTLYLPKSHDNSHSFLSRTYPAVEATSPLLFSIIFFLALSPPFSLGLGLLLKQRMCLPSASFSRTCSAQSPSLFDQTANPGSIAIFMGSPFLSDDIIRSSVLVVLPFVAHYFLPPLF